MLDNLIVQTMFSLEDAKMVTSIVLGKVILGVNRRIVASEKSVHVLLIFGSNTLKRQFLYLLKFGNHLLIHLEGFGSIFTLIEELHIT